MQADAAGPSEPQSLLLQRALPELSSVLESSREAILQNTQRLVGWLEGRLRNLQGSLDALLHGEVPITTTVTAVTSYFGTGPPGPGAAVPVPPPAPVAVAAAVAAPSPSPFTEPGLPAITALARVYTVKDAWREWQEGLAGRPAIRELEERWGSRWRPGNTVKVQFCRRKVIWDAVRARIARGRTEEEAVAELEQLRAGRSLNQLVDELHQRRQRPQEGPGRQRGGRGQARPSRRGRGRELATGP